MLLLLVLGGVPVGFPLNLLTSSFGPPNGGGSLGREMGPRTFQGKSIEILFHLASFMNSRSQDSGCGTKEHLVSLAISAHSKLFGCFQK